MELGQLRYFLAACDSKSFTKAAQASFTSRQNLTKSVHALERELGATFFTRSGNTIVLTVQGQEAERRARKIVQEADELEACFKDAQQHEVEPISIVFGMNASQYGVLDILDEIEDVDFSVSENVSETCYKMVTDSEADLAIVACMQREFPGCRSVQLGTHPFSFLMRLEHPLAKRGAIEARDLADYDVALFSDYRFVYEPFIKRFDLLGIGLTRIKTIDSVQMMKRTVRSTDTIAFVGKDFTEQPPAGMVCVPPANPSVRWHLYALRSINSPRAAELDRLVALLRERMEGANLAEAPKPVG